MDCPLVSVQHISKRFVIRSKNPRSFVGRWLRERGGFHDDVDEEGGLELDTAGSPREEKSQTEIWSLRDVTFDIARHQTLAVIGLPGSGKSTLLRLIGRMTLPTEGRIVICGRAVVLFPGLSSLVLPDRDPSENVRVLAHLLGARRPSDDRIRMILSFADLPAMRRVPVRRLGTDAANRLAVSTALHLDSDVLLVDDLPFGSHPFRDRCEHFLRDRVAAGDTVVVSTRDLEAAERLCSVGIWLDGGRICSTGPIAHVTRAMRAELSEAKRARVVQRGLEPSREPYDPTGDAIAISHVRLSDTPDSGRDGQGLIEMSLSIRAPGEIVGVTVLITMEGGHELELSSSPQLTSRGQQRAIVFTPLPRCLLPTGYYSLRGRVTFRTDQRIRTTFSPEIIRFRIAESDRKGRIEKLPRAAHRRWDPRTKLAVAVADHVTEP